MASFRFIHCSDLHIDSPFKGLSALEPELAESLRTSTFRAFHNIVRLAVSERVDAVVIAGDVFDSADKSLRAQLKFHRALKELCDAGIPVFVAHGNHDPLDGWSSSLTPPEGVVVFQGENVEQHPVKRGGETLAWIYGISYPQREVRENLATRFQRKNTDGFAVGVLHANVGQDPNHDNYAPCSLDDCVAGGLDYWALGHIHAHRILRSGFPAVVYCGNAQARHLREVGPKGCCLVTLHDNSEPEIRFVATDAVRFAESDLDLSGVDTMQNALQSLRAHLAGMVAQAGDREALVRVNLTGRTALHEELSRTGSLAALTEEVRQDFAHRKPEVWLSLTQNTQADFDLEALKRGDDFIADLLAMFDAARDGNDREALNAALKPLYESWPGARHLAPLSGEEWQRLLTLAQNRALDPLMQKR